MNGPLVVLFVCIALLYVDGMPIDDESARNHHDFQDTLDNFIAQLLGQERPLFGTWTGGSQLFRYKGTVNRGHPEFQPTELFLGSGSEDVGSSGSEYEELFFGPNGVVRPEFQYTGLVPGYGLADVSRPRSEYKGLISGPNGGDHPEFSYLELLAGPGSAHFDRPRSEYEELLFGPNDGDRPGFQYRGSVLGSGSAHLGRPGSRHNEWLFGPEGGENLDHFTAQLLERLFGSWIGGSQKFGYKGTVNRGHPEFQPTELLLGSGSEDVGRSGSECEELLFGPNGGDRTES